VDASSNLTKKIDKKNINIENNVRRRHLKSALLKPTHLKSQSLEFRNAEICTILGAVQA
jgi:hypothetical protein